MRVVYVTVRIEIEDTVDVDDFQSEVDYDFSYPGVVSTEITEVEEK